MRAWSQWLAGVWEEALVAAAVRRLLRRLEVCGESDRIDLSEQSCVSLFATVGDVVMQSARKQLRRYQRAAQGMQ